MRTCTPFRLEEDMLPLITRKLPLELGVAGSPHCTLAQAAVGDVIPDLLIGRWYDVPQQSVQLTYVEAAVFALIETSPDLTEGQILDRIFLSDAAAKRVFGKLERAGVVTRGPSGGLVPGREHRTDAVEIIAIEFKLAKWRDALAQAVSYRTFSDRSYVVLDGMRLVLTPELGDAFENAGVGLLSQQGACVKTVISARPARSNSPQRVFAAQKLKRALATGQQIVATS